jgi:hypothetical protein
MSTVNKLIALAVAVAIAIAGAAWWMLPTDPKVFVRFLGFHDSNGMRGASFRLENDSPEDFWCVSGDPASPEMWLFPESGTDTAKRRAGPNPATANDKDNVHFIKHGARADIWMPLQDFDGHPLTNPFRAGVLLQSPKRIRNWHVLQWLQFPSKLFGPKPVVVISDIVKP